MKKQISIIINQWDPLGLLQIGCPITEYDSYIKKIIHFMENKKNITVEDIEDELIIIFSNAISLDYFNKDKVKLNKTAKKIMKVITNNN